MEEHPDVFSDPNFSLTQLNTPSPGPVEFDPDLSFVTGDSMSVSGGDRGGQRVQMEKEEEGQRLAWVSGNCGDVQRRLVELCLQISCRQPPNFTGRGRGYLHFDLYLFAGGEEWIVWQIQWQ